MAMTSGMASKQSRSAFSSVKDLWADYLGVVVSGLCALHCALMPVLAMSAPHFSDSFESPWVHGLFFAIVAPLAFFAFRKCFREHGRRIPLVLGGVGLLVLSIFLVDELAHSSHGSHDGILVLLGSGLVISGHLLNLRYCKHTRKDGVKVTEGHPCCGSQSSSRSS